jgi:hypothetical protein
MTRAPSTEEPCVAKVTSTVLKASGGGDPFAEPNRALRPYVIWRKLSFANQSYRGDQFRPMILSIIETAKRLNLSTHQLLREICSQGLRGEPITTRLPLPNRNIRQIPH